MSSIGRSLTAVGGVLVLSGVALILTIIFIGPGSMALIVGAAFLAVGGLLRLATGIGRSRVPVARGVRS